MNFVLPNYTRGKILLNCSKFAHSFLVGCLILSCVYSSGYAQLATGSAPSLNMVYSFSGKDMTVKMNKIKITSSLTMASFFCPLMDTNLGSGYTGFQRTNDGSKTNGVLNTFISSLWNTTNGNGKLKVRVAYQNPKTYAADFSGEGDGKKSIYPYDWSNDIWYDVVNKAWREGDSLYVAAFVHEQGGKWLHTVTFARPFKETYLGDYNAAFLENWISNDDPRLNGSTLRKAFFKDCWGMGIDGKWQKPTSILVKANDSPHDKAQNGFFYNKFNAGFDSREDAYFLEHGSLTKPSAIFGGGRSAQLPVQTNQGNSPNLFADTVIDDWAAYSDKNQINVVWKWNQFTTPIQTVKIRVTNSVNYPVFTDEINKPEARSCNKLVPDLQPGTYKVELSIIDIFGKGYTLPNKTFTVNTSLVSFYYQSNGPYTTITVSPSSSTNSFDFVYNLVNGPKLGGQSNQNKTFSFDVFHPLTSPEPYVYELKAYTYRGISFPSLGINTQVQDLPLNYRFTTQKPVARVVDLSGVRFYLPPGDYSEDVFSKIKFPANLLQNIQFLKAGIRLDRYTNGRNTGNYISTEISGDNTDFKYLPGQTFSLGEMGISLYKYCPPKLSGWRADFARGRYNNKAYIANGASDDDAMFLLVYPGYQVTLYQHGDFTGKKYIYANSQPVTCSVCLGGSANFGDITSAVEVLYVGPDPRRLAANDSTQTETSDKSLIDELLDHSLAKGHQREPYVYSIYPNPASDRMTFAFWAEKPETGSLQIRDMMGRSLQNESITIIEGANKISTDVRDLPEGTYMVTVQTASINYTERVIITRSSTY